MFQLALCVDSQFMFLLFCDLLLFVLRFVENTWVVSLLEWDLLEIEFVILCKLQNCCLNREQLVFVDDVDDSHNALFDVVIDDIAFDS